MDNRVFNVNGRIENIEGLKNTLRLVFDQLGEKTKCYGWKFTKEHGLILFRWIDNENKDIRPFPTPIGPDECVAIVSKWLVSDEAKNIQLSEWDVYKDHDGHNGLGWRVYCEGWGFVGDSSAAICATKPVAMWYGK